jgi:hypothetical protein
MAESPGVHRLTRPTLRGTWAPVLLPVAPDEAIDFGLLREELAVLVDAGLDGIYTNGTASEFHCLEEDEYEPDERAGLAAPDPGGSRLRPGGDPGHPARLVPPVG